MGFTALMSAARDGNLEIVQLLVRAGAHLNIINPRTSGATALAYAKVFNRTDVIAYLQKAGAR
jgi:ankyrin repeat protein